MLCSECSKPVVPVVAIDIDGTLGDYHGHFLRFSERYLNRAVSLKDAYIGQRGFKEWFCEAFDTDERTWRDIKLAYRQGGMKRSMPLYNGADALCQTVRRKGAELWLTTTRPYLRLDNVDPDTRFWLEQHDIEYDGLLYDEFKYARLAEYVDRERVVAVVDDLPEMCEAASTHFGWRVPILRRNSYNKATVTSDGNRFADLYEVAHEILERISTWEKSHDNASLHSDA